MTAVRLARRSVIATLDTLAIALVLLAVAVAAAHGFVITLLGTRISFSTPQRTLVWLCLLIAIRVTIGRRIGPFHRWTPQWQRLLDSIVDEPFAATAASGSWRRTMLASAGIAAALALMLHEQLTALGSVPDLGDPLFSIWRISWVAHQIVTDPAHLFDGNIFYPEHLALTLSDPVILPGMAMMPLRALGIHPVVAYNILFLLGFWLSGVATYLLVDRLTASPRAAFIAGLIYATYSYRFEHYSHFELQMTQWMPLALLALHLLISTGRSRYALGFALALVAQLYSSLYYAVFFVIYATAIGLALMYVHRMPISRIAKPLAFAGLLASIVALPVISAFTAARPMKGERGRYEVAFYSALPEDYLRANQYSVVWRDRLQPKLAERTLFPGAAPVLLAAIALAPPLGAMRLVYAAGLLVAFDGSLGLNGIVYPLLYVLPGPIHELRAPSRFAAIVGLTLAILAGFGVRRVLRWRTSRRYQHAALVALVAFVMIDAWPSLTLQPVWKTPPPIYDTLQYTPNVVIAELPLQDNEVWNLPFMYFSVWHWARLVNGYSGFIPDSYAQFYKDMRLFPDEQGVDALRRHGVNYVTINCGLYDGGCDALARAMRRSKALRLAVDTTWMNRTAQLYEVVGP